MTGLTNERRLGKVNRVPPPAMALTAPAMKADTKSRSRLNMMERETLSSIMGVMEIDPRLAEQAFEEAYEKYPGFRAFGPKLVARALFQGHALLLEYSEQPPRDDPDAWEFQNAVVKRYKALAAP